MSYLFDFLVMVFDSINKTV